MKSRGEIIKVCLRCSKKPGPEEDRRGVFFFLSLCVFFLSFFFYTLLQRSDQFLSAVVSLGHDSQSLLDASEASWEDAKLLVLHLWRNGGHLVSDVRKSASRILGKRREREGVGKGESVAEESVDQGLNSRQTEKEYR